jgi:hypothetical protein
MPDVYVRDSTDAHRWFEGHAWVMAGGSCLTGRHLPMENDMRSRLWLAAAAVALASCGPAVRVSTSVAPQARFEGLGRFRVLTPPTRRDGRRLPNDPMLVNSIMNEAMRSNIVDAFKSRGYALDPSHPDFNVAYYASARERLDVTTWDYGYPTRWGGWYPRPAYAVRPFTEGTVIIDVIDSKSNELLWRGRGVSRVSDDPEEYQKNLREAVTAIIGKFPMISPPHIAAAR